MILGFKQTFPWHTEKNPAPTYFMEKILQGAGYYWAKRAQPKIHTLRSDPHNRWKPGRKIEMVYRGPKYSILSHFNKGIPELETCVSIQRIEIKVIKDGKWSFYEINIDGGKALTREQAQVLAINDGFDSIYDFEKWFNKDWSGKLIHWTDYRY